MHCARIGSAAALVAIVALARPAVGQESALDALRSASRSSPMDASAAVAYARALRRAGRAVDAMTELHRALPFAHGPVAIDLRYESARVAIDRGEHGRAMGECR